MRSFHLRLGASNARAGGAPVVVVPDGCIDLEWIDERLADRRPGSSAQDRATGGRRDGGGIPVSARRRPPRGWDCRRAKPSTAASRWRRSGAPMRAASPQSERGARYRRARAGDRERVGAARAIDSGAAAGHARGVRAARDRRAARQSADPLARRGARAERTDLAPALRRGIRIRAEDTRPHPAISALPQTPARWPAMARRLVSRWKPATPTRPISGAKAAGWRSRRLSGSQLSSRAARRNSGIASARAPGHV